MIDIKSGNAGKKIDNAHIYRDSQSFCDLSRNIYEVRSIAEVNGHYSKNLFIDGSSSATLENDLLRRLQLSNGYILNWIKLIVKYSLIALLLPGYLCFYLIPTWLNHFGSLVSKILMQKFKIIQILVSQSLPVRFLKKVFSEIQQWKKVIFLALGNYQAKLETYLMHFAAVIFSYQQSFKVPMQFHSFPLKPNLQVFNIRINSLYENGLRHLTKLSHRFNEKTLLIKEKFKIINLKKIRSSQPVLKQLLQAQKQHTHTWARVLPRYFFQIGIHTSIQVKQWISKLLPTPSKTDN